MRNDSDERGDYGEMGESRSGGYENGEVLIFFEGRVSMILGNGGDFRFLF